jgi:hypothetical protein
VDTWVMGTKVRRSGMDGRDKRRVGEEKDRPVARFEGEQGGGGTRRGGRRVEVERKREREGGPGHDMEQRGGVSLARQRPGRGARGRRVAA